MKRMFNPKVTINDYLYYLDLFGANPIKNDLRAKIKHTAYIVLYIVLFVCLIVGTGNINSFEEFVLQIESIATTYQVRI